MGLPEVVTEEPKRVSYERSLALVKGADGLLGLGVDDPNYQPSKLHTYLATGLPMMVLCHEQSDLPRQMRGVEGVKVLRFEGEKVTDGERGQVESGMTEYLQSVKEGKRWSGRKRLTVQEAVAGHVKLFASLV